MVCLPLPISKARLTVRRLAATLLALLCLTGQLIAELYPKTHTLVVTVKNVGSNKGRVVGYLFDSKDTWLDYKRAALVTSSEAKPGIVTLTFEKVPVSARYSLSVYHDENDNGVMDVGSLIPMPAEPVGASNHSGSSMPRFYDCSFRLKANPTQLTVTLREL